MNTEAPNSGVHLLQSSKAIVFPCFPLETLQIPLSLLPEEKSSRDQMLAHYFQEMAVSCNQINDLWNIDLSWPKNPEFYIDPNIEEGISNWASNVQITDIPFSLKVSEHYQESLNDNWTLYAWSKWWKSLSQSSRSSFSKITILHIDDHEDMMSPKLYVHKGKLFDLLIHQPLSIEDPESIKSAILSSSIGIGEFILPFLWEVPCEIEIRHLCARERENKHSAFSLELSSKPDLLYPQFQRLMGNLSPYHANNPSRLSYFVTDDINEFVKGDFHGPILLHIDLDYFNDRYDGCSNWREKKRIHDPNRETLRSSLNDLLNILRIKNLISSIDNVTISTSPGFFPSEYWEDSLALVRNSLL